nr:MAG TPA: Taeniidae antigen [Caudoviricetes sp.]
MTSIRKVRKKAIRKMGFRMSFQFSHKAPNQKLKLTPSVRKKIRQGLTEYLRKKCL